MLAFDIKKSENKDIHTKVDIDTILTVFWQGICNLLLLVVECSIKLEVFEKMLGLFIGAHTAHNI